MQTFNVWSVEREDVSYATAPSDQDGNEEAYKLTDEQMQALADRMQKYLEYSMDAYWDAVREAYDDIKNRTLINIK